MKKADDRLSEVKGVERESELGKGGQVYRDEWTLGLWW